jgi:hypothetical protein
VDGHGRESALVGRDVGMGRHDGQTAALVFAQRMVDGRVGQRVQLAIIVRLSSGSGIMGSGVWNVGARLR